jgi:hypothetical protein
MDNVIRRAQLNGAFRGFNRDMLFSLTDHSYWLQTEYKYWYHYAYRPMIEIFETRGETYLKLAAGVEAVRVRRLRGVTESQIADVFEGWQGNSTYQLTNGQVWRQSAYKYEYKYAYRPHALIYPASAGMLMDVDGSVAVVQQVR